MDDYLSLVRNTLDLLSDERRVFLDLDPSLFSAVKTPKVKEQPVRIESTPQTKPVTLPKEVPLPKEEKLPEKIEVGPAPIKVSPPLPEKKPMPAHDGFEDLHKLCRRLFPELTLHSPPNDAEAKKIAQRYLYKNKAEKITILTFQDSPKEKLFLENLANAISMLIPARVIHGEELEKKDEWEAFFGGTVQLIIACDYEIWGKKNLMKHYKEFPAKLENYLGDVPLFMLPNLSLYFKEPLIKASLWKALCQKLQKLNLLQ